VDYEHLVRSGTPIGLALRVGPLDIIPADAAALVPDRLALLARRLLRTARDGGLSPTEFQLDFDCAESRIGEYVLWLQTFRRAVAPVPVTVTVLPCWLGRAAFADLAGACDGFVLQVHSLERPGSPDEIPALCDPTRARRWIRQAARFGVPFRVALPTYGYTLAFAPDDRFVGLAADGPRAEWNSEAGIRTRTVRADAVALAGLVRDLRRQHPTALTGLLWYRVPVAGDRLNWSWRTLDSVVRGEPAEGRIEVCVRSGAAGVFDLSLANRGTAGCPVDVEVAVSCGRITGADALAGSRLVWTSDGCGFVVGAGDAAEDAWLRPGQERALGWVRIADSGEESIDVQIVSGRR
jgi:hypothetical protein